jgi:hypothetical protein
MSFLVCRIPSDYLYYFRATLMAPMCLAGFQARCYCADRATSSSPEGDREGWIGRCFMRMMHLCYAAIGFAVARWIFKRQAQPVLDPVTRFRSQGLL